MIRPTAAVEARLWSPELRAGRGWDATYLATLALWSFSIWNTPPWTYCFFSEGFSPWLLSNNKLEDVYNIYIYIYLYTYIYINVVNPIINYPQVITINGWVCLPSSNGSRSWHWVAISTKLHRWRPASFWTMLPEKRRLAEWLEVHDTINPCGNANVAGKSPNQMKACWENQRTKWWILEKRKPCLTTDG